VSTVEKKSGPRMRSTLGLTGLTMNAMALIAPGAFLWLTYQQQCQYGAPTAGVDIWFGIVAALLLCFATAISYAELSKLYPGAGSSYFFAEQAFLSKTHAYKFARLSKYIIGWASHLYYWVYPGLMVGVTAILIGYMAGQFWPDTFNPSVSSPTLMIGFCVVFAFGVSYIAYRGVVGATGVNVAVNIIQISALLIFAVIAIGYRANHPEGSRGWALDPDRNPIDISLATYVADSDGHPIGKDGKSLVDADGNVPDDKRSELQDDPSPFGISAKDSKGAWIPSLENGKPAPLILHYKNDNGESQAVADAPVDPANKAKGLRPARQFWESAPDVVKPHGINNIFIQACIAILILVGFESVTSMGEEARNAKRDIPRAVLLSLFIQGVICYLIEYFAMNYALNPGYPMPAAAQSSAPIGDMMKIVGASLFGAEGGIWFMRIEALTVFLALIGTTLSCINTGARVTYAMGRDDEVPSHFGMLHGKNLTPHRAIWTLAAISMAIGAFTVIWIGCNPTASDLVSQLSTSQKASVWYPTWLIPTDMLKTLPNSLLLVTLCSNFGTFMLYMLTNIVAIVAFREHHSFHGFKHMVVPVFGLLANLGCMLFYLIGPFSVEGMSKKEPFIALGVALVWGLYGAFYFARASKKKGKSTMLSSDQAAVASGGVAGTT
jgi:basic amino acid/polyamine antiporter, APA family